MSPCCPCMCSLGPVSTDSSKSATAAMDSQTTDIWLTRGCCVAWLGPIALPDHGQSTAVAMRRI